MPTPKFIHLKAHSDYSIIDGLLQVKPWISAAQQLKSPALALTDHCNLFALVKFYHAAMNAGIKPIIGCDLPIKVHSDQPATCLTVLCQNQQGFHNLTQLISRAYTQGQHLGVPYVDLSWLTPLQCESLIALSGGVAGWIAQRLLIGKSTDEFIDKMKVCFPDRFYLELQRTSRPQEEDYLHLAVTLAQQHNLPVVATNDVRFLTTEDFEAHEARVCINQGYVLDDPKRPKIYSKEQYFKSVEQMCDLFADIPEALENTVMIAQRCNLELNLGTYYLPDFPVPTGMTVDDFIIDSARAGLQKRLTLLFPDVDERDTQQPAYDERLKLELDVIIKMGFPGYFLIVADFIEWAKNNGVPVGPGRGSGAGSLVAYALGITDLDPLALNLLFERFLNPERVSMPDFDIDFCMEGRDRVIQYVADKYGRDSVSQIITYGTMAAKAVIRDVGRVLAHPYGFVDKLAKLIPFELGMTLDKALVQEETLRQRYEDEEDVQNLINLALKLEGVTRNVGKHAGGVVIAPSALTNFVPLYCEEDGSNLVTQFDKDDVEKIGLVKFDFLGLRTLTIIDWAVQHINARPEYQAQPLDINLIPLEDVKSFDLLKACQTTAVFQLESRGMKDLIHRLQPDCFDEITALVALFRPGPLQSGMVDDFIERKHGRDVVEYPHPDLEPILNSTYGVILYQEQVMQIAQVLANYSLGAADILRRAMGKKKPEEMAKQRAIFMEGAIKRDVDAKVAGHIFDLMEKFAGYGFNKSHSAAYALIAYQTAWLKAHYPAEFMAAVLSSDMDNTDKVVNFYEDCDALGLQVLSPDIQHSDYKFTVVDGNIRYGLGAIKGVGESAIMSIVSARRPSMDKPVKPFKDLFDFCERVDCRRVNRRVLEALIKAGAMDCLQQERASLFASVDLALKHAEQLSRNQQAGQGDLFSMFEADESLSVSLEYVKAKPWQESFRLQAEKETLGLYLSGHPLDQYAQELQHIGKPIGELCASGVVSIAGFIQQIRVVMTKRGDRMAIIQLMDKTGSIDIAVFSNIFAEKRAVLQKDQLVVIVGDVSEDEFSGGLKMRAEEVMSLDEYRGDRVKSLFIELRTHVNFEMSSFKVALKNHAGSVPIVLQFQDQQGSAKWVCAKSWNVKPTESLLNELREIMPQQLVMFLYDASIVG